MAVGSGKVTAENVTFTGNGTAVNTSTFKLTNVAVTGGTYGIFTDRGGKATSLSISGTTYGVTSLRNVRLVDSTITGNGVDLVTFRTPRLLRSTCDASARLVQNAAQPWNYDITGTWGICAND